MLPKLFSLRSDGKTQTWQIEIQDDKYRFISGILDSANQVQSEWTKCEGKNIGRSNETTPKQQAILEAKACWQKKCDKGYKTDPKDIKDVGFFEPMLAKDYADYKDKIKFPVWAQPKLDGMRCIVSKKGMFSRNGKEIVSAPHIFEALKPLFDKDDGLIFDGELYADKFANDFNTIMSLAKQSKPTKEDFAKSKESLQYHVYDLPSEQANFSKRCEKLHNLIHKNNPKYIIAVNTVCVETKPQLDLLYGQCIDFEYEGQMIRLDEKYENKRSKSLLKRKEFIDEEFVLTDIEEGIGNRAGMAGGAVLKNHDGAEFRAGIKGDREFFKQILNGKNKYIGKTVTVKYFCLTPDGIPRFPVVIKFDK